MIGIGIDTGGTCTDAVAFDMTEGHILASAKSQTTHDHLEQGIGSSLDKLPAELLQVGQGIFTVRTIDQIQAGQAARRICQVRHAVGPECSFAAAISHERPFLLIIQQDHTESGLLIFNDKQPLALQCVALKKGADLFNGFSPDR